MTELKHQFRSSAQPAMDNSRALVERLHTGLTQHTLYGVATRTAADILRDELAAVLDSAEHARIFQLVEKLHDLGESQASHSLLTRDDAQSLENDLFNLHEQVVELTHDIYTDPLTGAYNRRYYDQAINALIERGEKFSLLNFDIDHFKKVNDIYGHDGGDKVLQLFTKDLKTNVAQDDIVVRLGGEEFCAIIIDADQEQAAQIAERLRETVEARPARAGVPNITVSVGVAMHTPDETADALYRRADGALYKAKRNGRNRVELADKPAPRMAAKPVVNVGPGL